MRRVVAALVLSALVLPSAAARPPADAFVDRTELADAGNLSVDPALRVAHLSDMQLVDDDAPFPLRHEWADRLGGPFGPAHRPQEEMGDEILDSIARRVNQIHADRSIDLAISTGDNVDNALENELMRFLDVLEGTTTTEGPISGLECVPDGQSTSPDDDRHDREDRCTSLPPHLAGNVSGLADDLPWYATFGNHDGLVQGNSPIEPGYRQEARRHGRRFLHQPETVRMHFRNATACVDGDPAGGPADDHGHGYGFAGDRLCDDDPDNDAYYAFSSGPIRFVVLDTLNDDWVHANGRVDAPDTQSRTGHDPVGGYAAGAVDPEQRAWLIDQLETHRDQLVVIASHHTPVSWWSNADDGRCPSGCMEHAMRLAGYVTGEEIAGTVAGYDHVIAWIGGHTHRHRIQVLPNGSSGGFWNVETASLIDPPQEARMLAFHVGDDRGYIAAWPFTHDVERARQLAQDDPHADPTAAGRARDRTVRLWFEVPARISAPAAEGGPSTARTVPGLGAAGVAVAVAVALRRRR